MIISHHPRNHSTMISSKFYLWFLLLSIMFVRLEARPHERKTGMITQSFQEMFRRKILLEHEEEGDSGLDSIRTKIRRSSPGGPDPQHHFNTPMP